MNEEDGFKVPGWVKMVAGGGVMGLILWKAPILELLTMAFYVVIIPVAFIMSIGLFITGTNETFAQTWERTSKSLMRKYREAKEMLPDEITEEVPAPPRRRRAQHNPAPQTQTPKAGGATVEEIYAE